MQRSYFSPHRIFLILVLFLPVQVNVAQELLPSKVGSQSLLQIGSVKVVPRGTGADVEIATGSPASPVISRLSRPERIVLDFRGAVPSQGDEHLHVNSALVNGVRVALFQKNPPIARVVIDLKQANFYQTSAEKDRFVVKISDQLIASWNTRPLLAVRDSQIRPQPAKLHAESTAKIGNQRKPEVSAVLAGGGARNQLTGIAVSQHNGQASVQLTLTNPVLPKTELLNRPDRFVLDFREVVPGNPSKPERNDLDQVGLKSIRSSLFQSDPPITRVVLDLQNNEQKPTIAADGNRVVVRFPTTIGMPKLVTSGASETPTARPKSLAFVSRDRHSHPHQERPNSTIQKTDVAAALATARPIPEHAPAAVPELNGITPGKPRVTYQNGLLTIQAENSVLADVLYEVGQKTGATIDMPMAQGMLDRVVVQLGPGNPREVLGTMLQGSAYDYIIVEKNGGLEKLVLTPKPVGNENANQYQ